MAVVVDSDTFAPICWVKNPFHPVVDFQCSSCGQLPIACKEADYALTYVTCEFGCGATYCCTQCRDTAVQQNHEMLCVGPYDELHPIYKLKVLALESGPQNFSTIHLAAMLVCCFDYNKVRVDESCLDLRKEAFAGTYELLVQILTLKQRPDVPTSHQWQCILRTVAQMKIEGTTKSKFALECERLTTVDEWLPGSYLLDASCEEATLVELMDEPAHFFPATEWTALYDKKFNHSCIPTHCIRSLDNGVADMQLQCISDDNKHDCTCITTISMIDNSKNLTMRIEEMDQKGQSMCRCFRCAFERYPSDNLHTIPTLQTILDLAILQARYDDAMDAIEGLVRLEPTNATWLFTRARVAGWQHDFGRRERLLQTAVLVCLNDKLICNAHKEVHAYYRKESTELASTSSQAAVWGTVEGLEGCVFVGERILDPEECVHIVHVAEKYQQEQPSASWTTSRHYAVPTTDIPICQIPEILAWFNVQLETTIFPAMEKHFNVQGRLRIFDAFLVKYDADAGQKRLPLHNDQSDYSLTIAMNSIAEYGDGGTYFVDTNETYQTDIGGILSFRGDLLHAGKRITRGTRYVIVCFIYQEATPGFSL